MRTALIDSDIVAYQVAARFEERIDFGDGPCSKVDLEGALAFLPEEIARLTREAGCTTNIVCLSDRNKAYFRKDIYPEYKANRSSTVPPALLSRMKAELQGFPRVYERPGLEADDVMGILASHPRLVPGEKVIVSDDKDMKCIPFATLYVPRTGSRREITRTEAARFHMMQTLQGDATDGYPGCPGIGPKKAEAALAPLDEAFKARDWETIWAAVLAVYASRGFDEEYALTQARMARILRSKDYNFRRRAARLWTPSKLF